MGDGPKRILIITSNEDLIRQVTFNELKDTFLIDLDGDKQKISSENNLIINLSSLSELTELNSSNDRLYKRALDCSDSEAGACKSIKVSNKCANYACAVCSDHAIGYNYGVLSCAPCKIFFRRNANQNLETMRCLTGEYACSVGYTTRRKCARCRLQRCFSVGMNKQLILTEEEKQQRRKKRTEQHSTNWPDIANESQCKSTINQTCDPSLDGLSIEDWLTIEQIQCSFVSLFEEGKGQCACVDVTDRTSALISWSQLVQQVALRFINYFRQIEHFEQIDLDDRLVLIKYNIFPITLISKCFYYKTTNDCCSNDDNEHAVRQRRLFLLCGGTHHTRALFVQIVLSLVELTKQNPIILSLLSVILVFSRGLSMNENEPMLKNSLDVYRAQAFYIKVLWNYLLTEIGEIESAKYIGHLIRVILQIQSSAYEMRQHFRRQYTTSDVIDRIAPIMQSVLNVS